MKLLLLYLLLLTGCTAIAQPYQDITSDWCKMGLKGKVKEMRINSVTKTEKKKKTKIINNNTVITFTPKGYIKRETTTINKKRPSIVTFTYKQEKENELAIVAHGLPSKKDSIKTFYVRNTDTSFSVHNMFIIDTVYHYEPLKYIYNNKQQLLSADVDGSKKWGTITEIYQYNEQGQRVGMIVNTTIKDSIAIHKYDIQNIDRRGNPTVILETKKRYPTSYTKTQHITYTYYD